MWYSSIVSTICVIDIKYYFRNILRGRKIIKAKRVLAILNLRIFVHNVKRRMTERSVQTISFWENALIKISCSYKINIRQNKFWTLLSFSFWFIFKNFGATISFKYGREVNLRQSLRSYFCACNKRIKVWDIKNWRTRKNVRWKFVTGKKT